MDIMDSMSVIGNEDFLKDKYLIVASKPAFDWLYKMIETRYWYCSSLRMPKDHKDSLQNMWLSVRRMANERESFDKDAKIT